MNHDPRSLLDEVVKRRAHLAQEDRDLSVREQTLRDVLGVLGQAPEDVPANGVSVAVAPTRKRRLPRALPGALEAAVSHALASGGHLTNAAIRVAMKSAGYPHALTTAHISRELAKMVEAGKLKSSPNGAYSTYWLAKGKGGR